MKRDLEKVAPEDYAHYTQQLKLQLGMFENLAPNNNAADRQRALDHIHCAVVQASQAATAFARYVRGIEAHDKRPVEEQFYEIRPPESISDLHR